MRQMVERYRIRITRRQAEYILRGSQIDLPLVKNWAKAGYPLEPYEQPRVVAGVERIMKQRLQRERR